MKLIDKTPFLNESGEISFLDQIQATMKFGRSWYAEIQAQKVVIQYLNRALDRGGYILLRNAQLPGTGATIPMILAGPTGVFVMYATHLKGRYRTKGDTWGTIEGEFFKPAPINLIRLTSRMAGAVYVYLQRQGYVNLPPVEGVLLAADPGLNVDSVRPAVRVVMRDALERFAFSIAQSRVVLSSEAVHEIIERLQNPHFVKLNTGLPGVPEEAEPVPQPQGTTFPQAVEPEYVVPGTADSPVSNANAGSRLPVADTPPFSETQTYGREILRDLPDRSTIKRRNRTRFSGKQWFVLLFFVFFEVVLLIAFFIVAVAH